MLASLVNYLFMNQIYIVVHPTQSNSNYYVLKVNKMLEFCPQKVFFNELLTFPWLYFIYFSPVFYYC